jgi:Ion transport protein
MNPFNKLVLTMIVANAIVLALGLVIDGHEEVFERAHDYITVFFGFETLVRLHGMRWSLRTLLSSKADTFDVVVIVLSFLPMLEEGGLLGHLAELPGMAVVGGALLGVARLARLVHFARHLSHLRLFRFVIRWGSKPRPVLEITDVNGKMRPLCFFCQSPLRWWRMRITRRGWVYGPCCKHRAALFAGKAA